MEPQEVNVIIYTARNLQSKRSPDGACMASVIFGIGKEKFRTDCVKGNNPTWNEESSIQVTKAAPLVFTVTDREDVLGTVTVPLDQIPSAIHKRRWVSLSKKNTTVSGELCFDCWVTSFQKQTEGGAKWSLKATGFMRDKMKRRSSIEMSSISLKGSRSVENLYSTPELSPNSPSVGSLKRASSGILGTANEGSKTNLSSNSPFRCPSSLETSSSTQRCVSQPTPVAIRNSKTTLIVPEITRTLSSSGFESNFTPATITPEITGLSPKCGPVSGGTRITLRGRNLGNCLEDIMSLSVCGCDLLSTLEYHSSAKLVCVTKPWNGCGPVVIVTKSAGRGSSTVTFSFETQQNNEDSLRIEKSEDIRNNEKGKVTRAELLNEITRLRKELEALSDENERLKNYVDRVMLVVMETFPNVLENLAITL